MKVRLPLLLLLLAFILASPVSANEALLTESSGSLALMDGDTTDIRMVSEEVIIELGTENYTVDATFEFINEGDTVTVPVGFPNAGYGYFYSFRGVKTNETFQTWVNGEQSSFKDMPGYLRLQMPQSGAEDIILTDPDTLNLAHSNLQKNIQPVEGISTLALDEFRWLVKDVTFIGGETTVTRVRYTAEYGNFGHAEYIYGTGSSWKGSIGTARFIIKSSPECWMLNVPTFSSDWGAGRTWVGERTGEFEHVYILTGLEPAEDEVMRLFVRYVGTKPDRDPWISHGEFIFADSVVDNDFLDILSFNQLSLFRDTISAVHGKIFDNPARDSYFKERLMYTPSSEFRESSLTDIDRENIQRIDAKEQWLRELVDKK
ncbi:YARHG domain-containing protein [Candidatus Latescibacterota bacterium]